MTHRPAIPHAQPSPEVLRAKRAKGQPGRSDVPIRLRANEQRVVRGLCTLCTLCSQPIWRKAVPTFARLLASDLAETVATISRDWSVVTGDAEGMLQQNRMA